MTTPYAPSSDVQIAYDVVGDGPIDVVYAQGFVTHPIGESEGGHLAMLFAATHHEHTEDRS